MSAKEMFEELGFTKSEDNYFISYTNDKVLNYTFIFSKEYECVEVFSSVEGKIHYFTRLSKKLLKAINKQMEELRWNE
jgi:hypothetical protein